MARRWLRARQTKYAAYATAYILVVAGIAVAANVLANRYNRSWDSTASKRYTLSDQTIRILGGLTQDVTIRYYDQSGRFQPARDLLDRYASQSSRVRVEYVDPDRNPQQARAAGVTAYGTTIVQVGDKTEQTRMLTEQEVSGALIRALKDTPRTVCFLTGSGEHRIDDAERDGYSRFEQLLRQENYSVRSISLLQEPEIPADCTVIVAGGPTSDYQPAAVEQIRNYVERGGRAMFLLDPPLRLGRPNVSENEGLVRLLAGWGATLRRDLILDLNPIGQIAGLGPQVALVTTYTAHPIVEQMQGTATGFPLARSLETRNMDKTAVQPLFSSSESSLATTNLSSPAINPDDPNNTRGPFVIGAAGTYYPENSEAQGRFVVVGSSSWAANSFIGFNGNSDLALNAMNWLSSDEELISIRPKELEDRRITMTNAQMRFVRLSSQFALPLVVVLAGVTVWWRRR